MAIIVRCDSGCGAESPRNGMHVANTWMQMRSAPANKFKDAYACDDKVFCPSCWARIEAAQHYVDGR